LGPKSDVVTGARDLLQNKNRRTRNQFLVEGPQGVEAALQAELVSSIFVADWDTELAVIAREHGVRVNLVTTPAMEALSETVSPQGIVAVCSIPDVSLEDVLATKPRQLAVCVGISDPGNLGTIIRTAAASGVDAVITTAGSVDAWSGKVVRATAGTFTSVPVIAGLDESMLRRALQANNFTMLATTGGAAHDIYDKTIVEMYTKPHAWLLGNEAHGLPEQWLFDGVVQVKIPMEREVESLNVASAAAVCFFASQFAQRFSA
jgi:TrmH family RNA methyltransferase